MFCIFLVVFYSSGERKKKRRRDTYKQEPEIAELHTTEISAANTQAFFLPKAFLCFNLTSVVALGEEKGHYWKLW